MHILEKKDELSLRLYLNVIYLLEHDVPLIYIH